jgi:hypothetical protein
MLVQQLSNKEKQMNTKAILVGVTGLAVLALLGSPAFAASGGASGATLQGSKTVDICDNGDGNWTYSGVVSVWNTGTTNATGCQITDNVEVKNATGPNWSLVCQALSNASCGDLGTVTGDTLENSAFDTTYSCTASAVAATVRNNANITISNHSGGRANGPNPKATYSGAVPPCSQSCGCSLTQGYWKTHPDDPAWSNTDLTVFGGATGALAILNANGGNTPAFGPWYILAKQYIAYLLNVTHGSCTPSGLNSTVTVVASFFAAHTDPVQCAPIRGGQGVTANPNPCNAPLDAACILDVYNHGQYINGPVHCGEETNPDVLLCGQ